MQAGPDVQYSHVGTLISIILIALLAGGSICGAAAHADALSDLRMTLGKLSSPSPIAAAVDVKSSTTNKKQNDGQPELAEAHFDIQVGDRLSMRVNAAALQRADAELQAAVGNADHPTPTARLLGSNTDPLTIEHLVSRGPALLRLLADAGTAAVSSTTLWGKPARELIVQLPPPKSKNVTLKDYHRTVSIWLDATGTPLAVSDHSQFKACLLFLCATTDNTESDTLEAVNGRLIATTSTRDRKLSGLGRDSDSHIVYTLSVTGTGTAAEAIKQNSNQ